LQAFLRLGLCRFAYLDFQVLTYLVLLKK